MGLLWSVADVSSDSQIQKTDCLFSRRYQSLITSCLGVGPGIRFLSLVLGPCLTWVCAGPVHTATLSVSSHVWVHTCVSPVVPGRHDFLGVIRHFWLLQSLLCLFHKVPWGKGLDKDMPFGTEGARVSCSWHIVHVLVFVLVSMYCKEKLHWWDLGNTLIWAPPEYLFFYPELLFSSWLFFSCLLFLLFVCLF